MRSYPWNQVEIEDRLSRGERITGPHQVTTPHRRVRLFTWPNGSTVHSNSINAMLARGAVELRAGGDGIHEIVLREQA